MTRIINLLELVYCPNTENAIFVTKEVYGKEDLLIAQFDKEEDWYDITKWINPPYLKTGYTMYILTKHIK